MSVRRKWLATISRYAVSIAILACGLTWAEVVLAQAKRKIIRLEAIKVEGRIQKPQAFYILQRSNLNFEGLELKQSFIPKIVETIDNDPF